jgi:uracil-DNA glycosylase
MLSLVPASVFLWNVFPLHPHEPGIPLSNRAHKPHERRAGEEILAELLILLRPRRLIAIGNDAEKTATRLAGSAETIQVRHPSYGGQRDFINQVTSLYDLKTASKQLAFL